MAWWMHSANGVCPCTCNYVTDSGCQCRDMQQAINVTLTKSAVYATYPLTYVQAFNYQPYEVRGSPMLKQQYEPVLVHTPC